MKRLIAESLERRMRRQRAARRFLRVAATVALWRRNWCVEQSLRAIFGDVTEANGHLFHIDPRDRTLGAAMRRRGILNPPETRLYARNVKQGMTVVDAGANIGYFTLLFARSVGADGRVIAFEPDPTNADLLARNIALNGYSNITLVRKALADRPGEVPLYLSSYNFGDHRLGFSEEGRSAVRVPVTTLDGCLAPGTRVDFLKMDIQGAEAAALEGARRVILENPRLAIATEFWPKGLRGFGRDPRAFLEELDAAGYDISIVGRGAPELLPVSGPEARERLASRTDTVDLYCVRGCSTSRG